MKYRLKFLFLVIVAGIISALLHELGHCIFYWIQGIPAGMSLVMEFPLINITAKQYGIGSSGGPIMNIILIIFSFYFSRRYAKRSKKWNIFSALLIANTFYFIFRTMLGLIKNDGGEIQYAMNLLGLDFYVAAIIFLVLSITILLLWTRKFNIKISLKNISYYLLLFISYLVVIQLMETIDKKYFWSKYPEIEIENVRIHNPHN